jgi:cobaltochelatase CobS
MHVAESLNLPFRFLSVCPATTKSDFLGYRDASGVYRSTAFREIYESGGVFLIDEIDNGNPSILAVLNTALANDHCAFPDGNIERHEKAVFVAAANTIGRGADVRYIGRNALDATTLDRFVFVRMDIDENLENALTGGKFDHEAIVDIAEGGPVTITEWRTFVRQVRHACAELGIEHIVSPRATIYGSLLISAGVGKTHLEEMCIWKGMRETDRRKVIESIRSEG